MSLKKKISENDPEEAVQFKKKFAQVFKSKRGLVVISIAVIALLLIIFLIFKALNKKPEDEDMGPPPVMVSTATMGPVVRYINAIGTLSPYDSVEIKAETDGKIERICFTEGRSVKSGELLIEFDDKKMRAELEEAKALYTQAKGEFDAFDKLANRGAAARLKREEKKADMDSKAAKVAVCKVNLEKCKILAPFGGTVGLKQISKGQFVTPGTELVKLVDTYPLKVDFKVAEADIGNISIDQDILIFLEGEGSEEYHAQISAIDPECEKITHSFNVRALLDVPQEIAEATAGLKPGRFVSVKIPLNQGQQGILVPESAIEKSGGENTVYVIREGIAMRVLVTLGVQRDGNVEVITGVNEGDLVVTRGQAGVLDGRPVSIQKDFSLQEITDAYKNAATNAGARRKR